MPLAGSFLYTSPFSVNNNKRDFQWCNKITPLIHFFMENHIYFKMKHEMKLDNSGKHSWASVMTLHKCLPRNAQVTKRKIVSTYFVNCLNNACKILYIDTRFMSIFHSSCHFLSYCSLWTYSNWTFVMHVGGGSWQMRPTYFVAIQITILISFPTFCILLKNLC